MENRTPTDHLVQNQAELAAIVRSSHDAIMGKTPDGRITSWSPGAERLYGYTAAEMVSGVTFALAVVFLVRVLHVRPALTGLILGGAAIGGVDPLIRRCVHPSHAARRAPSRAARTNAASSFMSIHCAAGHPPLREESPRRR
jgi:PAS domain-containing protein